MHETYHKLLDRVRDLGRLSSVKALLDWDQEVMMPARGVEARAQQVALLAGLEHEWLAGDEMKRLLDGAKFDASDEDAAVNARETRRLHERSARVPKDLVEEIARQTTLAREVWVKARDTSDFAHFAPMLTKLVELKTRVAQAIGFETEPYEALVDEFEPGARVAEIERTFSALRDAVAPLVKRVLAAKRRPDESILARTFPKERQVAFARRMAEALRYDFDAGRIDVSAHPFCTTIGGYGDVRVTTRYHENNLSSSVFGILHEVGHALYELGLPAEHMFTPLAQPTSLGIHESQSRLWENFIGRSREFWECHYAELQRAFPEALGNVSLDDFHRAVNAVRPSLIRVEADELTYNLHITVRFEIERALFTGALAVRDVPGAWNEKMERLVGVRPPDDRRGCLQDIHWSIGAFGYFPTYALGNLYAAQFYEKACADLGDLPSRIRRGDLAPLLTWLRENIHRHGQRYRAADLVRRVTGKPLSVEPFVRYATSKFEAIYR
ncbi:MAG: carboxypeptidase M32 [Phycisphaerales bacterium]|nr:carboxypeptidase M32 [Phycisphaerales bacterium]